MKCTICDSIVDEDIENHMVDNHPEVVNSALDEYMSDAIKDVIEQNTEEA